MSQSLPDSGAPFTSTLQHTGPLGMAMSLPTESPLVLV